MNNAKQIKEIDEESPAITRHDAGRLSINLSKLGNNNARLNTDHTTDISANDQDTITRNRKQLLYKRSTHSFL